MEWVITTGESVEAALDAALDQLGVDENDVEYEVLDEPKVGLFGRVRGEARLRARVRPARPRPKEDRRDRRRSRSKSNGSATGEPAAATAGPADTSEVVEVDEHEDLEVALSEQGQVAATFMEGVLERFGLTGSVSVRELDEETVEVAVEGDDLGLLIGPKGVTLSSLQDVARTVVQRKTGARRGRLLLDVAGYRQRRKEALERFAAKVADDVKRSGTQVVLEPMHPADRKIVHDTINSISGVMTTSEGEEPRRRVVILPEASTS